MTQQETVHVRPAQGGIVRNPVTGQPIPEEGVQVRLTTQVRRYLRRGDLELVETLAPKQRAPKGGK